MCHMLMTFFTCKKDFVLHRLERFRLDFAATIQGTYRDKRLQIWLPTEAKHPSLMSQRNAFVKAARDLRDGMMNVPVQWIA